MIMQPVAAAVDIAGSLRSSHGMNPPVVLHGPEHLAVFTVISIGAILWVFRRVRAADTTHHLPVPQVPVDFDPYEIAYLRGGPSELVRLIFMNLVSRKYLHTRGGPLGVLNQVISVVPGHPPPEDLDPSERLVFGWICGQTTADILYPVLPKTLEREAGSEYQRDLQARQLLVSPDQHPKIWRAALSAFSLIAVLAIYNLFVAASQRSVGHALLLIVLAVTFLIPIVLMSHSRRLTALGRKYLARLQQALKGLQNRIASRAAQDRNDLLILAAAAFGIGSLASASYGYDLEGDKEVDSRKKADSQSGNGDGGSGCGGDTGSASGGGVSADGGAGCGDGGGGGCGGCGGCGG